MPDREKLINSIYQAIDEVNESFPEDRRIAKSLDTILSVISGHIDSLGITILIVALEQKIEEDFGMAISLADGAIMPEETTPFRTIGTLVDHISSLLEDKVNV